MSRNRKRNNRKPACISPNRAMVTIPLEEYSRLIKAEERMNVLQSLTNKDDGLIFIGDLKAVLNPEKGGQDK